VTGSDRRFLAGISCAPPVFTDLSALRIAISVLVLSLSAGYALAFHCPKDMAKIDAAMKTAQLSPEDNAKVETYREEGEALHKAGKHQESINTLAKAMQILDIK
jgi:hypothetical protein